MCSEFPCGLNIWKWIQDCESCNTPTPTCQHHSGLDIRRAPFVHRLLTVPRHMETGPAVFISHHTSVLKPLCNYYHGVIVFIELEIKTSPGDKMSVSFMLAHIYQFTVIEPVWSLETVKWQASMF